MGTDAHHRLMALDWMLPKLEGLSFCKQLRQEGNRRLPHNWQAQAQQSYPQILALGRTLFKQLTGSTRVYLQTLEGRSKRSRKS